MADNTIANTSYYIELRKILKEHQDQLLTFMNSMEDIRWKFVTAFGIGAGFSFFFASTKSDYTHTITNRTTASLLLIIISIASLITQIRIYGLVHSAWCRIQALQRFETFLVKKLHRNNNVDYLFEFPHITFEQGLCGWISHLWTVHMATCMVFCFFISIGVLIYNNLHDLKWCLMVGVIILFFCWFVSLLYTKRLNHQISEKLSDEYKWNL
jgi:hypothetical protein